MGVIYRNGIPYGGADTHYTTHLYAGASTGTAKAATTNGNTHLIVLDESTARDRVKIAGTNGVNISSDANNNISIKVDEYDYSNSKITLGSSVDLDINPTTGQRFNTINVNGGKIRFLYDNAFYTGPRSSITLGKQSNSKSNSIYIRGVESLDINTQDTYYHNYNAIKASYNTVSGEDYYKWNIEVGNLGFDDSDDPDYFIPGTTTTIVGEQISLTAQRDNQTTVNLINSTKTYSNNAESFIIQVGDLNSDYLNAKGKNITVNSSTSLDITHTQNSTVHNIINASLNGNNELMINLGDSKSTATGSILNLPQRFTVRNSGDWYFMPQTIQGTGDHCTKILGIQPWLTFEGEIPANATYTSIPFWDMPNDETTNYIVIAQPVYSSDGVFVNVFGRLTYSGSFLSELQVYRDKAYAQPTKFKGFLIKYR